MDLLGIKFKNKTCFKNDYVGFDSLKPINVIIGKNNSGKSQLLNLLETQFNETESEPDYEAISSLAITDNVISQIRQSIANYSGGNIYRQRQFLDDIDKTVVHFYYPQKEIAVSINNEFTLFPAEPYMEIHRSFKNTIINALKAIKEKNFRRIYAERDISSEHDDINSIEIRELAPDGKGATRIFVKFCTLENWKNLRKETKNAILDSLNEIFGKNDFQFSDITFSRNGAWQIELEESLKGIVPLQNSGSGLKTILLVLFNMLLLPVITGKPLSNFIFAFEELENNLHPALFRRLLHFISERIIKNNSTLFLTTHSNIALDFFASSSDAQIISVSHNGEYATTKQIVSFADRSSLLTELGVKASDLLQANGIIWVEGPSDRIYINKWISLYSEGEFLEGRDYQCAYYGGSLLADYCMSDEKLPLDSKKIDMMKINRNAYVICDSDKSSPNDKIKPRVRDIQTQVKNLKSEGIDIGMWTLGVKEIENYLTATIVNKAFGKTIKDSPKQFENFFPKGRQKTTYLQKALQRSSISKVFLAEKCTEVTEKIDLLTRFDWNAEMGKIITAIKKWNSKD